jgi:ATP phosphoribosyltransferase
MAERLIIAVPSKGRLQENTSAFFARAGLSMSQEGGVRDYRGTIRDMPGVEIIYLSASDIAAKLASGDVHLGVTGEDLVRESIPDADSKIEMLTPLGFGHANVVVAVPKAWIDCSTMEDLEEITADFHARHGRRMRVATKYITLTRRYFASKGVADYRIVESLGATEGAPAAGAAELIVDITTSGATLEANSLKVLTDGVMLRSQANLVASMSANWTEGAISQVRRVLGRISAEQAARTTRQLLIETDPAAEVRIKALLAGASHVISDAKGQMSVQVPQSKASEIADQLLSAGARRVTVAAADYVFAANDPLTSRLMQRIGRT